jgi:hypothetical protein
VSVVFAAIELKARPARLRRLIHYLWWWAVDDLVKGIHAVIADMGLLTRDHAGNF